MLPRHGTPSRHLAARTKAVGPASADLRRWLGAPGSLTARLRLHGAVTVEVLAQGHIALLPQERRALGCSAGHVREVLLRIDGRAAIWARSATPLSAIKGPWSAIKGLGKRPLAELLFSHRGVLRGPLHAQHVQAGSPLHQRMARAWLAQAARRGFPADTPPRWARHSLFTHQGRPLQVLEAFAPWMLPLPSERR